MLRPRAVHPQQIREHKLGVFLPIELGKPTTLEKLARNIRPFAAVA